MRTNKIRLLSIGLTYSRQRLKQFGILGIVLKRKLQQLFVSKYTELVILVERFAS